MAVFPFVNLPNQWTDGEEINAAKMFARVDTQLNALANASFNPPRFKGSIKTATAISSGTPIKYPPIYDTASAWNVTTGIYTCPLAGTYQLSSQMKWGAVTPGGVGMEIVVNSGISVISVSPPNANFSGPVINAAIQMALGDQLSCQVTVGFTTQNDSPADNNFLILAWQGI